MRAKNEAAMLGTSANSAVESNPVSQLFENLISLLNYKQAAQCLGISEPYLRRLKSAGEIPWVPIGRRGVRFSLESLNAWIRDREIK